MRKSYEELNQLKQELGVNILWSWSKINTYMTDPYEYMLKYILHIPEDRNDGIYATSGGLAHDIVEQHYTGKFNHEEMLAEYEDKLFEFNTMGLMYDRSDDEKNEKIAKKYEDCMRHFFLNHKKFTNKPILEPFVLIKVGDYYFQGYIDILCVEKREGKNKVILTDWKTSSIYKGKKLIENAGQLLLYGEGIHQKNNISYKDIIIRFNFMKYVNVEVEQKNGKIKIRQIERNVIGENLQASAKVWLKSFGYDENEIDTCLDQMIITNSIDCLPEGVKSKFKISDCYVEVELNEEIIENHKNSIIKTIEEIIEKEKEYKTTGDKYIFWQDVTKENSYYHANLSGYSASIHLPYKKYLDEYESGKQDSIFDCGSDVGSLDWLDEILG